MASTEKTPLSNKNMDSNLIPPIVLGCIFGMFIIILITCMYCFCARKRKKLKMGLNANHNRIDTSPSKGNHTRGLGLNLNAIPAIDDAVDNNQVTVKEGVDLNCSSSKKVHENLCLSREGCCTLDRRYISKKKQFKVALYKSLSSPSLLGLEVENKVADTTALLQDCNISELTDIVGDLNPTPLNPTPIRPSLERSQYKDSFDPFCYSEPADNSLQNDSISIVVKSLEEDYEKVHVDNSSMNYKEISNATKIKTPTKMVNHRLSLLDEDSDNKSSGYSEDNASDNFRNFSPISKVHPLAAKHDIGYHSDISSYDVFPSKQGKVRYSMGQNLEFFSEDEAILHSSPCRPKNPPSYTQAVVDIERMSDRSEKTDCSDISFDYLLEMERQLGVQISDSKEKLCTKPFLQSRYRHSMPRNYFSEMGYTSDNNCRDKYSSREKKNRCNQLLEEFRLARQRQSGLEQEVPCSPTNFHFNVVNTVIPEEGTNKWTTSCSSTLDEWLV